MDTEVAHVVAGGEQLAWFLFLLMSEGQQQRGRAGRQALISYQMTPPTRLPFPSSPTLQNSSCLLQTCGT